MNKVRCFLAAIALVATLSGLSLQGMGLGSVVHAASSQHVAFGQLMKSGVFKPNSWPCGGGGGSDC